MKQIIVSAFVCIAFSNSLCSQSNKNNLVKEAEEKLKTNQSTVSQILTDKKYDGAHPETSFRNLIEKYCNEGTIAIATDTIPGKKIKVIGTVKDPEGKPVPGALVYMYHTDARGWYAADAPHVTMNEGDFRHARLFGYVKTDKNGMFELHTIKAAGYPQSDLPAHIHVQISAPGYNTFQSFYLMMMNDWLDLSGKIRSGMIL